MRRRGFQQLEKEVTRRDGAKVMDGVGRGRDGSSTGRAIGKNGGFKTTPKFRMLPSLHADQESHERLSNIMKRSGVGHSVFDPLSAVGRAG